MKTFLSTKEVARFLGVNEKMVYTLVAEKGLPATKVTGKWLFPRYLVEQWLENETINFFKSDKSERWWMEINYTHNKTRKSTLIPCAYQDYLTASDQIFPERWLKTFRKLN